MNTELGPYRGEVGFPDTSWGPPLEEPLEETFIEGEFWEYPEEEGVPSWTPEATPRRSKEEDSLSKMQRRARKLGYPEPQTYEDARIFEAALPRIEKAEEFRGLERKTKFEELEAHRREWRKKYKPDVGKTIRTWLKPRPKTDLAKIFFPGDALRETYLPGAQVRRLTIPPTTTSPIGEINRPRLEQLQRASAPPPTTSIKAPFRDVERQEGLGPALGRLRGLGKFPEVDWAVYSEIHANGDIDIPSHVRREVGQLGFSRREIDDSLKRLRNLGLLVSTGQVSNGEKELMVAGGTDGN